MKDYTLFLQHILDSISRIDTFTRKATKDKFLKDEMMHSADIRQIEIIGEAASTVTPETRQLHPDIPWRDIVAMRNRLIHVYFDIDLDRVWDTLTDDLPKLIAELDKIVE